ncbi:MAG: molecular chaperone DjiA [Marinovum sp.]|nr:molecular chaperone DjiA [Marinovum sp.]
MSLWSRISEALAALAKGESLSAVFERFRTPPERTIAFTIAVIALGAKMAKADGLVTRDEVAAFREVFHIARGDEPKAAQVFNLARQDVAGFEDYARRVASMFDDAAPPLQDLMEGLFHIAVADGHYHPNEDVFLERVAEIFGVEQTEFMALRARFVPDAPKDPYTVLGVTPDMEIAAIRKVWRAAVKESHPDRMIARGVPEEAIRIAERRLQDINKAWEAISVQAARSA